METRILFLKILMFLIFSIAGNSLFGVPPVSSKGSNSKVLEVAKSKKDLKIEAKLERQSKRLEKKLAKINGEEKKMTKGTKLIIIGVLLLLIGILVMTSGGAAATLQGFFDFLFKLMFGIGLGVGGIIMMIIGLVQNS